MLCFLELLAFIITEFNMPHLLILGFFLSFFYGEGLRALKSLFGVLLEICIWFLLLLTLASSQEKPSGCKGQILALLHCKPLWPRALYMWSFCTNLSMSSRHLNLLLFSHSVMSDSLRPHRLASLSITNSWSLLKFMSMKSLRPSNHFIHCCPFLLLPSVFPSIKVFSKELVLCIR